VSLRVVFMGTPDFAVPTLETIAGAGHEMAAVYTRAPAASGRGLRARPSPVQQAAERLGIPVETPASLKGDEAVATLRGYCPDVAVVVAYGMLLPQAALDVPVRGCLNLHASLLPRWRGAAPIQRAIIAGDPETGVAVMRMEAGLDTGPVGLEARVPIGPDTTAGELHDELAVLGAGLMVRALRALETNELSFTPQSTEGATYARKITNDEARIDWRRPARAIHDQVRGLSPFPGAFFEADFGRGLERVKVLRTALADGSGAPGTLLGRDGTIGCGEGALRLIQVQRSGKAPIAAEDFWRGTRLEPGAVLT
jgi:methionyl-tRNA formyltransferase